MSIFINILGYLRKFLVISKQNVGSKFLILLDKAKH